MVKVNLSNDLQRSIVNNWQQAALSNYEGASLTYQQLAHKILELHYIFEKNHIKKGDKVALIGKNSVNWAVTYLATVSYGAVIVPILADFKPEDIQHIVNHSDALFFFTADSIYETMDESKMPQVHGIFSLEDFSILHCNKSAVETNCQKAQSEYLEKFGGRLTPGNFKLPEVKNEALATIVYTSGTTGFSKGVMLLHNSLSANIQYAQNYMPLKAGDNIVSFMPLAHLYGCAFEFLFPLTLGCHVTFLTKTPSPKIIVKSFKEIRPQLILSVPLIIEKIYKKQIMPVINKGAVKYLLKIPFISDSIGKKIYSKLFEVFGGNFHEIVIGGAALNPQVEVFLRRINFPFTNGYGMTECGPLISYASWKDIKPYSVGRCVDTLEIKIASENPEKIVGEVLVRGDNVMQGYYKNPQATREAIDKDGWLHTGDLGLIDKDGYIYLRGRSKFMILGASGQNIYPEEIEAKINSMKYVNETIVTQKNNRLVALVYPDYEAMDEDKVDETKLESILDEYNKILNENLPAYSAVTKLKIFPEEFEKTPTKKIKRFLYNLD